MSARSSEHFIGIGKSTHRESFSAGRDAARQAMAGEEEHRAHLALVFATGGYDHQEVLRGITDVLGDTPLSGCSTSGVITQVGVDESTHTVIVLAIRSERMTFSTFQAGSFGANSRRCGEELVRQIQVERKQGRLLLLFPDGVAGNVSELLNTLASRLDFPVTIAGGTASELLKLGRTWQYHNGKATHNAVSAVLIQGDFIPEVIVCHGCSSIGTEQIVTRAENGWIFEINGKSAWSVFQEYLDVGDLDELTMSHICYLCLAERLPEPDPFYGGEIIRCPLQLDKKTGALFFPGNIRNGTRVRMALRSAERTVAGALDAAKNLLARHPGVQPDIIFQFDCSCRARLLFGKRTGDVLMGPLHQIFGPEVPWFGFNTYGEIAPLSHGQIAFHNYSIVLCALYSASQQGLGTS